MTRRSGSLPSSPARLAGAFSLALTLLLLAGAAAARNGGERSERWIGPGVRLLQWRQTAVPNALYAVEVDGTQPFIRLGVCLGRDGKLGLDPLSRHAERLTRPECYPIAGVNGDYFYPGIEPRGIPTNAAVVDGELVRTPFDRSSLILPADGAPSIRILRGRGQVLLPGGAGRTLDAVNQPRGVNRLVLYTPWYGPTTRTRADGTEVYLEPESFPLKPATLHRARVLAVQSAVGDAPLLPGRWVLSGSGAAGAALRSLAPGDTIELRVDLDPPLGPGDQVLGGGPRLLRDGRISVEREGGTLGESFARARFPRTAIGINGRRLCLLVVDGRQPGYSAGMSLYEVAQVLLDLGCTDALNMDGGGSTTLWIRGSVMNRPSDGRERAVANGLLVFSTAPKGDPVRLQAGPEEIRALAGAAVPLELTAEDQYYNPVPLPEGALEWSVESALGTIREGCFHAAGDLAPEDGRECLTGRISARSAAAQAEIPVRVYPRPARVEIVPAAARLGTRIRSGFQVRAYDRENRLLALPAGVRWEASPEVGAVDASGSLLTGETPGQGTVTAWVNGVAGTARVEVAAGVTGALEEFETAGDWKLQTTGGAAGKVGVAEGTARSGRRALRLEYDLGSGTGTRAVYALGRRVLGSPLALKLWVYGDGQGAWLRVRLRDGKNAAHLLDLARRVDWRGAWRELRLPISEDLPGPVTLEALYVVEPDPALKPKGALLIDDLSVER